MLNTFKKIWNYIFVFSIILQPWDGTGSYDHSSWMSRISLWYIIETTAPSVARASEAHYSDVIMGAIASQITSLTIVYSIVYSDADQRKHKSSASLAFVRGIHRGPVNSPHKWPVTRKMLSFDDVIMYRTNLVCPEYSEPWFNIKMTSYQYRKSHCGDKTVVSSYYLHNGIFYTGKMSSLYWISPQVSAPLRDDILVLPAYLAAPIPAHTSLEIRGMAHEYWQVR